MEIGKIHRTIYLNQDQVKEAIIEWFQRKLVNFDIDATELKVHISVEYEDEFVEDEEYTQFSISLSDKIDVTF